MTDNLPELSLAAVKGGAKFVQSTFNGEKTSLGDIRKARANVKDGGRKIMTRVVDLALKRGNDGLAILNAIHEGTKEANQIK